MISRKLAYSLGRLPRSVAMQTLGLADYGALLRMLTVSGLAQPIIPTAEREQQVEQMLDVLREAGALAGTAIAPAVPATPAPETKKTRSKKR